MSGRVHLLLPGHRSRVKCGAPFQARGGPILSTRLPSSVTCHNCLGTRRREPQPPVDEATRAAEIREYVAITTLVDGQRREILPCECGATLVAGVDHTCHLHNRRRRGLSLD